MGNSELLFTNMIMTKHKIGLKQLVHPKMQHLLLNILYLGPPALFLYRSRGPWAEKG